MPTPLLIISDAITGPTGLGRITREVAVRIHEHLADVYRVGVCGYGGTTSRQFTFAQYPVFKLDNWAIPQLPTIWNDFAGDEKGIMFFIWNASWLPWVSNPDMLADGDLKALLKSDRFSKWGYFPIDAEGPNGRLHESQAEIMAKFDRLATYTEFGKKVIDLTGMASKFIFNCAVLPHGTEQTVFYPRSRREARKRFLGEIGRSSGEHGVTEAGTLLATVATNTARKDWPLAFETCQELLKRGVNVGMWAHTDGIKKYWDLPTLAAEFGMKNRVVFTNTHLRDESMAWGYAACNATLGIGSGEGWGLPVSESLAMGIPCVTGDYAGAAEFTPQEFKVTPSAYHYDGFYINKRPVYSAAEWADKVMSVIDPADKPVPLLDRQYLWSECWAKWEQWLREGAK